MLAAPVRSFRPLTATLFAASFGMLAALGAACSSSSDADAIDALHENSPNGGDGGATDSGTKDGGSKDAGKDGSSSADGGDGGKDAGDGGQDDDAGTDAGTFEPIPGAACTTIGEIYEKRCGKCGTMTASCSPQKIVTGFGACTEPTDACEPGTHETQASCGYCGTTSRVCNDQCAWVEQQCTGEVTTPDRCVAGTTQPRTNGCENGVTRPWTCDATCAWTEPTMTCEEASKVLVLGETVGSTTSKDFTQVNEKIRRMIATTNCELSSRTDSNYAYVEVRNPNGRPAKVDLGVKPMAGQAALNAVITAYDHLPDTTSASRLACMTGTESICLSDMANYSVCLFGTRAPTVPANGKIWVYVGNFDADAPPVSFTLSAKIQVL